MRHTLARVNLTAQDAVVQCPHAAKCPGCDHIGVPYADQLAIKAAAVRAAIAPYAALQSLPIAPVRGAAPIEKYRRRLKWVAGKGGALGLFERGGHHVVDLPSCAVASPLCAEVAAGVRALVRGGAFPSIASSLRAIDVREVTDPEGESKCLLTLVLVRERRPARKDLTAAARVLREADPRILSISLNWAPAKAVQILGDETEKLSGVGELLDRQGKILVTALPGSFVQAHGGQAIAMAEAIVEGALALPKSSPRPRVLELYAGAAPFGLALARAGCDVTAVESFVPAAEGAKRAAKAQQLSIKSLAEDATRAALRLGKEKAAFDLVVVDPPRRGLGPVLRAALAALSPRAIAYVSCDPTTLARDLEDFVRLGYAAQGIEPWDFMPLTAHVESLTWLGRTAPPPLVVLARDAETAVVDAPPHADGPWVAARAARELKTQAVFCPTLPGASGALRVGTTSNAGRAQVLVAVRGVPRGKHEGWLSSLEVKRSSEGRTLVSVEVPIEALPKLGRAFGRAGHPILGDPDDAPTTRYLAEKHGVDRPLAHVTRLEMPEGSSLNLGPSANIPGDLAATLARLGLA